MAQLAVVLLALFAQMERTYMLERAAHARAVATAKGRRIGQPVQVDAGKLAYAAHLRDTGHTVAEIVAKSGIARTSLYRYLLSRPPEQLTVAAPTHPADPPTAGPPQGPAVPAAVHPAANELLECARCGDGPFLTAELAEQTPAGEFPDAVKRWLTSRGWSIHPELICSQHLG